MQRSLITAVFCALWATPAWVVNGSALQLNSGTIAGATAQLNNNGYAADYVVWVVWRNSLGTNGLRADGNADGDESIDGLDFAVWKSNCLLAPAAMLRVGSRRRGQTTVAAF